MKKYIAIDMGASSIRVMVGSVENKKLDLDEIYRFKNSIKEINGAFTWDIDYIVSEIKKGIKLAFEKYGHIDSLATDSWGCDYVLMDEKDNPIYPVYTYRDPRTLEAMEEVHKIISKEELYSICGNYPESYNTIYQLYSDKITGRLDKAAYFLSIPEYIAFKLTGKHIKEYTLASTSGLIDAKTKEYSSYIIKRLGLKEELFESLHDASETVGEFTKEVEKELGGNTTVKLALAHDTASAFYVFSEYNCPIISSGTWSLLGVIQKNAHTDLESMKIGFTNEGAFKRDYTYIRNIMGMWLVNNLCKEFGVEPAEFVQIAANAKTDLVFDANDRTLLNPKSMFEAICKLINIENKKENRDIVFLATLKSLAKSYAESVSNLEKITGEKYDKIVIVGGGAKNQVLNNLTEEYSKKKVLAYAIEASTIGNILSQSNETIDLN